MTTACVFSIDDAYVMPFQVFFHSLETTHSIPEGVQVFVLHTDSLCRASIGLLTDFFTGYGRTATFLDPSSLLPDDLPLREGDHVSAATFYRLFIADILPAYIERAVYLDADMLALRSIQALFSIPLEAPVAAADCCNPANELRLWGAEGGTYFQAGVLLIPLHRWREDNMSQRFNQIMRDYHDEILWWDQDVLNIAFRAQWQRLSVWFNVAHPALNVLQISDVQDNAALIHFSGRTKPWNSFNPSPFTNHWDKVYNSLFGIPFDRSVFLPPPRNRLKAAVRSRISGLIHGRD